MPRYYLNRNPQPTGEREVHRDNCSYLPDRENQINLGIHSNCRDAVREAKRHYSNVDGCYYCSPECHTR